MDRKGNRLPEPGTGPVALGCVFILVIVGGLPAVLGSGWAAWLVLGVIALIVGLLAARRGDPFFEKVVHWLPWWW